MKGPVPFIAGCLVLGGVTYLALELSLPLTPFGKGAHQLAVALGFLVVPLAMLRLSGRRPELGGVDRGFLAGVGLYMLFLSPLLLLVPANPQYFRGYRMEATAFLAWALLTLLQVGSVDFFTKRIVQLESERAWGAGKGMALQFLTWAGAHVLEYGWLKDLAGPAGAALFLGLTGAATGLVYWRTKNVTGMMAGHWLLNLGMAAAAVIYYSA